MTVVPIDLIHIGRRLREASPTQVEALRQSVEEVGLLNPIAVSPHRVMKANVLVDGYILVAGLHRLEACKALGHSEIEANILDLSGLRRQIAECDENLRGPTLTPSERALFTQRRKEAYEALHPETRHGTPGVSRQVGDTHERSSESRFTADTAVRTGQSERSVQRDATRGERIAPEILQKIRGTELDKGTMLDRLSKMDREQQDQTIRTHKPVPPSQPPRNDLEVKATQVNALMAAWNKASREAREEFLTMIDKPVMDRKYA